MPSASSSAATAAKWDRLYLEARTPPPACWLLQSFQHLLPRKGLALDLACGLGGNALFLAEKGLEVEAWDISRVAILKLRTWAKARGLQVCARCLDVLQPWPRTGFDVIVVSRFLARGLLARIKRALKPGGLLYYQTFVRTKMHDVGPRNPEFLLEENELLRAFSDLTIRFYREEGRCGNLKTGLREEAYLIGEKP